MRISIPLYFWQSHLIVGQNRGYCQTTHLYGSYAAWREDKDACTALYSWFLELKGSPYIHSW